MDVVVPVDVHQAEAAQAEIARGVVVHVVIAVARAEVCQID